MKMKIDDAFIALIDEISLSTENNPELSEGLHWIDMESRKHGVSFYEMALMIMRKHMAERRAKDWLSGKGFDGIL